MSLYSWTTLQPAQIRRLAAELATQEIPIIVLLEPVADFEELTTFTEARPTPIGFTAQQPAWRLESVAARVREAIAIAAHEPLNDDDWEPLARILLAHTEYLYTYPDAGSAREKLDAGIALALASSMCHSLPQADLWRLAAFGRIANSLAEVALTSADAHLIEPLDIAFSLANELHLPILKPAISAYNAVRESRTLILKSPFTFPLTTQGLFRQLNLDFPGMEQVKPAVLEGDFAGAASAYTEFRRRFLAEFDVEPELGRCDTASTAKSYLDAQLRLSIHPAPAISGTTEIGIAALLFPEFRGSEQLLALALRRYKWITDAFFYPDGFHRERTLRAQVDAIADFARFLRCRHECQFEELQTTLDKLIAACIALSHPERSFPELGTEPAPNFRADELASQHAIKPQTTSIALPDTGYYVMRESGKPDAQYLLFDTAQLEIRSLFAHRRQLLVGTNAIEREASDTRWITTPTFDFVESWHNARKRSIFYVKGHYFVVHELLLSQAAHTGAQLFRLAPQQHKYLFVDTVGDANTLPAALNTLLFPFRTKSGEKPTISPITVNTDADVLATGFTVAANNVTDTFLISDDGFAAMSTTEIQFSGEYLFLRGEQFVMLNAQFLKVGDKLFADFDEPREHYVRMESSEVYPV